MPTFNVVKPVKPAAKLAINPLLHTILTTSRPTKHLKFCTDFCTNILDDIGCTYVVDKASNITVVIPSESGGITTMFTSHTDTVHSKLGTYELEIEDEMASVKGGGVLGADCGSGMYIMFRMIMAGKPGVYVFFAQEEMGRVGSEAYSLAELEELLFPSKIATTASCRGGGGKDEGKITSIQRCISFDRKGYDNLITHQMGEPGLSRDFIDHFERNFPLAYKADDTGSFTDSYTFFGQIPECTNLSVGYFDQHSQRESQDLEFLELLVDACIEFDWESLPTKRDPAEYVPWDNTAWYYGGYAAGSSKSYGKLLDPIDDDEDLFDLGLSAKASKPDSYGPAYKDIYEYVYDNPEIAAEVLEAYGITLRDLLEYERTGVL